jgi:hypothetical protein
MIVVQRRRSDGEVQEEQKGIKGEKKVAGAGISAQPGSKGGMEKLGAKSTGSEAVPKQPTAGPSTHKLRRWNYNWGCHVTAWRLSIRKASATAYFVRVLRCT